MLEHVVVAAVAPDPAIALKPRNDLPTVDFHSCPVDALRNYLRMMRSACKTRYRSLTARFSFNRQVAKRAKLLK
jgi:hypothetical protein